MGHTFSFHRYLFGQREKSHVFEQDYSIFPPLTPPPLWFDLYDTFKLSFKDIFSISNVYVRIRLWCHLFQYTLILVSLNQISRFQMVKLETIHLVGISRIFFRWNPEASRTLWRPIRNVVICLSVYILGIFHHVWANLALMIPVRICVARQTKPLTF